MDVCYHRQHLVCFILCLVYISGHFAILAVDEVCSCQRYSCNKCPTTGPCTRINVALGKTASVSSLYNNIWEASGPACVAVNGNLQTQFVTMRSNNPACVISADGDISPHWEVDLGGQYAISSITVYGGEESDRNMLRNTTVTVDGKHCHSFASDYFRPIITEITCSQPLTGSKVRFQKAYNSVPIYLALCQVQVWVCNDSYYGPNCTNTCGRCSSGSCDPWSGECPQGCSAGYQAPDCKETCDEGWYGVSCSMSCGNCLRGITCDVYSGVCPGGCSQGYQPPYCNKMCSQGKYGPNCNNTCGSCSEGTTCNVFNGECPRDCKPGYLGSHCTQSCRAGTYGVGCKETCGNCTGNSPCNVSDGRCETGCAVGYQPPFCKEVCSSGSYGHNCSSSCENCSEETSTPVSGKCPAGCNPVLQGSLGNEDRDGQSSDTAGPIVGAVVGSVVCGLTGFLLGVLFMRYRHHRQDNNSAACFSEPVVTELSNTGRMLSSDYVDANASTNVYDSLKTSHNDNTASDYTNLTVKRTGDVKSSSNVNTN